MKILKFFSNILVPFKHQTNEGIFSLFHNNCSESNFEKLIQISASSVYNSSYISKNTFIWNSFYFCSINSQNSWFLLQFFNFQISMKDYRIIAFSQNDRFTE
jgi:hypothetical protein